MTGDAQSNKPPERHRYPYIEITEGATPQTIYVEPGREIVFGTQEDCSLILPYGMRIFPRHASIEWSSQSRIIRKLFEPAEVEVNGEAVKGQCGLKHGDRIRMGDVMLMYSEPQAIRDQPGIAATKTDMPEGENRHQAVKKRSPAIPEHMLGQGATTIGRDRSNTLVLYHEMVSRVHAKIEYKSKGYYLTDLNSTNGTFLNGQQIRSAVLTRDDNIQIGDFEFIFTGSSLKQSSSENEARLDVLDLRRTLPNGVVILNDISISINPGELVAIVGGSGAGKSTLMNAMGGFSPADSGHVLLNGRDFYKYYDAFRSTLGYVPQDDIIHKELPVYSALYYSACLRMPPDISKKEREVRIQKVMEDLQLLHRKNTSIWQLSGGERKRVSIGVELLTRPRLFFLDEPTSGLDPGLESDMMHIFRRLANQGHTTILITHATKNLGICDRVVFLARGGYLAFYGTPKAALKYFSVDDFIDIYIKLEREQTPAFWRDKFAQSREYQEYVMTPLKEHDAQRGTDLQKQAQAPGKMRGKEKKGRTSQIRQFFLLSRRYLETIVKDGKNLAILLMQAPLIGALIALIYKANIFDQFDGSYRGAKSLLTFLTIIIIWFGTSNSAREISKEIHIYKRERFINLGVVPYIFSKVMVLFLLNLLQTAIMCGIIFAKVKLPGDNPAMIRDVFLLLLLLSSASMAMGLMISAIVNNPDKAASLVPIILIPQIVLCGGIIPIEGFAEYLSYLTLGRWGYELLGYLTHAIDVPYVLVPVLKHSPDTNFDIIPITHWEILGGYLVVYLLVACLFQRLKDYTRIR